MNKRELQRQERRGQILNCSLDMLISRGYEATKIRDIADKLQISLGLFFNYFESKEKVYEELIKMGLTGPEIVLKFSQTEIRPVELFEKITETIFQAIKSNSLTAKMFLLMAQTLKSESAPESVKKLLAGYDTITPLLPVIRRGQELGEIKNGDPTALIVAYWGAVQGIAESVAIFPHLPLPESSWVVDILRA